MATETDCLVERDYAGELLETTKRCYEELKKTSEMLLVETQRMKDVTQKMQAEIEKQKGINQQLWRLSCVVYQFASARYDFLTQKQKKCLDLLSNVSHRLQYQVGPPWEFTKELFDLRNLQ